MPANGIARPFLLVGENNKAMRHIKRWVSIGVLTTTLIVALGLSPSSVALAQEARWMALYNQTIELIQQGKYREADTVAKEALKVAKLTFGPNHPAVATSLNNLAVLYRAQGRYAQAEPLYKRALVIREKALGPGHPRVANVLKKLANIYQEMGRDEEAKKLLERAKRIRARK